MKGAIKRTQPVQGEFLSNLFLAREKNGGYRPVINLKILNQVIPFLHFKMERLSQLKHLIQLDLKMLVFWSRLSTKGDYKVIEDSNLSPEKNEHQSDNIFGRYVDLESHNTRISHESRHSHISPAELGLCSKYNKINFVPMSENRIFGNGDRFNQNDFVIDDHRRYKKLSKLVRTFSVVILQLFWN